MNAPFDILIAPDGRIFAHNLTPALAAVLAELNPDDEAMQARAGGAMKSVIECGAGRPPATNREPRAANA